MTSARAKAMRCCWPPESWFGRRSAYWAMWTDSRASITRLRISSFGTLRSCRPKATFSATVMWGHNA